jgi:hypothetical protein
MSKQLSRTDIVEGLLKSMDVADKMGHESGKRVLRKALAHVLVENTADSAINTTESPPYSRPVIISLGHKQYRIGNKRPVTLGFRADAVLQAFLKRPSMDFPALQRVVGYSDSHRILKDLKKRFGRAVVLPGGKGKGGYHVSIRTEN